MATPTIYTDIQEVKFALLNMNAYTGKGGSSFSLGQNLTAPAWEAADKMGNKFISDVIASIEKWGKVSEKQAYCVARFIVENKIEVYA